MRVWKWVGLAGIVGATAVGVAVGARTMQRRRREYVDAEPDVLAEHLRARFAEAQARRAS